MSCSTPRAGRLPPVPARVPEARAVVTLATPADAAQVADPGQFGVQVLRPRIATLRRALLVIHSPDDEVVSFGNARVIFEAARHPKSFISLDGADHLLARSGWARAPRMPTVTCIMARSGSGEEYQVTG